MVSLREHLHLRLAVLESLLAMSEATLAWRVRQESPLEPAVSERLDRLLEAIGAAQVRLLLQAMEQGAPE